MIVLGEKYREFYEYYFGPLPATDSKGEVLISNPWRSDSAPSLYLNLTTGQFKDFGDDLRGDVQAFYMQQHDVDYAAALTIVNDYVAGNGLTVKPIPEALIDEWHANLMENIPVRAYLVRDRGISIETLRRYKIGWYDNRYAIPVRNEYGFCVNVRRYDPNANGKDKMISYATGYGNNRLFPIQTLLENETVVLHEGEWDTLLQQSNGFPAITATGGAGSWYKEWTAKFKDKIVYICYDSDDAGFKGSRSIAIKLAGMAKEVYLINLPLAGTKDEKDITDFYVKLGNTKEEFQKLMDNATLFIPTTEEETQIQNAIPVSLAEARSSKFKNVRISFDVQVVGKNTAPYNIPRKVLYKCSVGDSARKVCQQCGLMQSNGEIEMLIPTDPSMLELIKTTKSIQNAYLKSLANIPTQCRTYTCVEQDSTNIEEILIAPEIPEFHAWNGTSSEYLVQTAFFVNRSIESNRSYRMEGVMTPDPWNQHVTFVLDDVEPLQDTVESFRMSPEMYSRLKVFQTNNCRAKFEEIHRDFEDNVTHIVGRQDLLVGIDLVFHSVLGFNFQNIPVQKGWLEFLCMGDTRTGKSETTEAMLRHYRLGEVSVAENTSYAGLVGGLQQTGDKRWFLTWGKIPLNDSRLFVIDEASGLSQEDIAKMSGIRSSGIAEITKIQTERTTARTRLIWLSNPRSGNPMASYSYGVQAVAELVGKAEDISRFDFVVSAAKDEVSMDKINKLLGENDFVPHRYTSDLCKQLILWVWSRKPEDIVFEQDAVALILEQATLMGEMYSSQIPLVEGANHRIKLARLAVAAAARVFSTDSTGEQVIVKRDHVQFSCDYLNETYSKPSLNYKGYSVGEYLDAKSAVTNRANILTFLGAHSQLADLLSRQDYFWARTLEEQLSLDRSTSTSLISELSRWRMIKDSGSRGYKKTAGFISILREYEMSVLKENEGMD